MRFQNSQPSPPFGGRDRIMVFMFLGALGIFFAVKVGSKPEFWAAMRGKPGEAETKTAFNEDPTVLRGDENFFAPDAPGGASNIQSNRPVTIAAGTDLSIPSSNLKSVRDNTMGIRTSELPSYYAALEFARRQPIDQLANSAEKIPYTMLMAEPWLYRGKPVTIKGRLRGLIRRAAEPNRAGIQQLYDAWVFTKDSGSNPIHVVCTSVPAALQLSQLDKQEVYSQNPPDVTLTGYFFKTQGYQSQGDGTEVTSLHTAPLVLAGTMNYIPVLEAKTADIASDMVPWLWWFAIGVSVLLGMVLWNFAISDWSFRQTRAHGLLHPIVTPDFHGVDAMSTNEMLMELSHEPGVGENTLEPVYGTSSGDALGYDSFENNY